MGELLKIGMSRRGPVRRAREQLYLARGDEHKAWSVPVIDRWEAEQGIFRLLATDRMRLVEVRLMGGTRWQECITTDRYSYLKHKGVQPKTLCQELFCAPIDDALRALAKVGLADPELVFHSVASDPKSPEQHTILIGADEVVADSGWRSRPVMSEDELSVLRLEREALIDAEVTQIGSLKVREVAAKARSAALRRKLVEQGGGWRQSPGFRDFVSRHPSLAISAALDARLPR